MSKFTVIQINTFPYKATGSIMMNLHRAMLEKGINSYVVWGRGRKPENKHEISIEDKFGTAFHGVYSRLTDKTGFASTKATKVLLKRLDEINPNIIHIHNIHGYYINIELLFDWLHQRQTKIFWTLHDCWAFTGHCAYFDACGCEKWKTGCEKCGQLRTYPKTIGIDNSKWNWKKRRELVSNLDITIITPCKWLKGIVKQSFLGDYPVKVIHNGIDLGVFHPTVSNFKKQTAIDDKNMLLGVASEWTERKGLFDFIKLYRLLDKEKYRIVLVGLTGEQVKVLPDGILGIKRTSNISELVEIYSAADCFLNLTYEDNYPTTNLESIACGTPVVTYRTGGSPESVNEKRGVVFEKSDINAVAKWITEDRFKEKKITPKEAIQFDKQVMIDKYLALYSLYQ